LLKRAANLIFIDHPEGSIVMIFQDNSVILFQGDSITDAGRDRSDSASLGYGYANLVASWLSAQSPAKSLHFLNRGIGGDRASDLRRRWQTDALDLKPDWVSIMIGINDTWRRYDRQEATSAEQYEQNYRAILEQSRDHGARIIIMEPFVLPYPDDRNDWREDLDPKIVVARRLAREFAAVYVPLDGVFAAAAVQRPMEFWAFDGVHPTHAGHALIAQHWLQAVGAK
jgi:acyl-CoA thioesterase I